MGISVLPLLSFGASATLSSMALSSAPLPYSAILGVHPFLYVILLGYTNVLGTLLIEQYLGTKSNLSVIGMHLACFSLLVYASLGLNLVDSACLVYLREAQYLGLSGLLLCLDIFYLMCIADIKQDVLPDVEPLSALLEETSTDDSSQ